VAADDIYEVKAQFEAPSGNATVKMYYQEDIEPTAVDLPTRILAEAWAAFIGNELRGIVVNDWWFPSIVVQKLDGNPAPTIREDMGVQVGAIAGPSLPANNALLFNLGQETFSARSNGKLYWPPPAEADQTNGVISTIFSNGPVADLASKLIQTLPEVSAGAGRWRLGVISQKVLNFAPPFKDWAGAFAPVTYVSVQAIIATQRRRQTKVRGAAL